jgi:hypothetical protein
MESEDLPAVGELSKPKSASSTDTYSEQTVWVQEDLALP